MPIAIKMLSGLMTNKKKLLGVALGLVGINVLIVAIRQPGRKEATHVKSETTSEPIVQTEGSAGDSIFTSVQWAVIGGICIFGGFRLLKDEDD